MTPDTSWQEAPGSSARMTARGPAVPRSSVRVCMRPYFLFVLLFVVLCVFLDAHNILYDVVRSPP